MKVIQFAFDARESSNYLPHTYPSNCVVYTGTHDNDTTRGWYHAVGKEARDFAKEYMCKPRLDEDSLAKDFIAMAMSSVADLCVIPCRITSAWAVKRESTCRLPWAATGYGA